MPIVVLPFIQPTVLNNQSNGKLDPAILESFYLPGHRNPVQMLHNPRMALQGMAAAVKEATGLELTCTSVADVYRNFAQQEWAFLDRTTTDYIVDARVYPPYNGEVRYLIPGRAGIAYPGTSNHGLASAIDTAWWFEDEIVDINVLEAGWNWLIDNAVTWGWSWEGALPPSRSFEPWHLRYVLGDKLPILLTPKPQPTPVLPPATFIEDDKMQLVKPSVRILDTRDPAGPNPLIGGQSRVVKTGCPAGTKAAFIKFAIINPTGDGFATLWDSGPLPLISDIDYSAGVAAESDSTIVPLNADGTFTIQSLRTAHCIVDLRAFWP